MKFITKNSLLTAIASGILLVSAVMSHAQTQVYSENFEVDHRNDGTWVTNSTAAGLNPVNLFFDYSTVGIPSAPHSVGGSTHGLKMQANLTNGITGVFPSGVSVSPNGFSITENFEMRWDWWLNYNGPLNGGGNGSTQIGGAGFGTAGTSPQVAGATFDSVVMGASGDGTGTGADYRVYSSAHSISYQDADRVITGDATSPFVYFAGTRQNNGASGSTYYMTNFPSVAAPAAQTSLYPQQTGVTQSGSQGFAWHDVSLKKVATRITYTIDGHLIATADTTDVGTLGGFNILFTHFDINAGPSTDPNAQFLAFSLFDNVRITNFPTVVTVAAATPTASETGPTQGMFTLTRTSSTGTPLTVNYTMSGTASNGLDYTALSGSVTFSATETTTNIFVTPVDDGISELPETVVLTLVDGPGYVSAGSATVTISDNDIPTIDISVVQNSMYERLVGDYAKFRLTRRGNLDASTFDVNISYGGSASAGVDYTPVSTVTVDPGVATVTFDVHPIDNASVNAERIVSPAVTTGTGYAVGSNALANARIIDDESPAETVLWSDSLQTNSSPNWNILFGAVNPDTLDYTATWEFDYNTLAPAAPHSGTDTHGLRLTVNKSATAAAGVNLYPIGQSFSGDYAFRFDMYLLEGSSAASEHCMFGINHSGTKTNWFRNAGVVGGSFDGLFYSVESDGAAQFVGDYVLSSSGVITTNPTALIFTNASALTNTFKTPPWTAALGTGGVPANLGSSGTPSWADVEIRQLGNIVTLSIDKTVILTYTNATAFKSGNVMLGYNDAFDSVGSADASVIFANARVISLATPTISNIQLNGSDVQINFTGNAADVPGQFVLQSAALVTGPYADVNSTMTAPSAGTLRATIPRNGGAQFYRIKRIF
ncbi:MAG: hypothetical protein JWM68_1855 [Verrucomicrobiales bacterium]|nr:hypothetical protein [Verrucomicrobiales bacterium]